MSHEAVTAYYQLRAAEHHFQKLPDALNDKERAWVRATVARQLQLESRVLASPEAAAVVVPDPVLGTAMAQIESQYDDSNAFLDDLQALGLTVSQLNDLLERQLRVEQVLEQQAAAIAPVSEKRAREYYETHPEKFCKPERRQAYHLLITVNPDYPENAPDAARARLEQIRREVGVHPDRFAKRARRYSECPSALQGGELGWIPRGQLYPQLDQALFALAPGEVSELLETGVGLHLVQCRAIQAAEMLPFESVAGKLREKLLAAQKQQAQRAWLQGLDGP